jgi:cold shock CspA family protein
MTKQGRITYFMAARHFGFISCLEDETEQYFFHDSNHVGIPALSQIVTFELAPPIKEKQRVMAVKVTPITGAR